MCSLSFAQAMRFNAMDSSNVNIGCLTVVYPNFYARVCNFQTYIKIGEYIV